MPPDRRTKAGKLWAAENAVSARSNELVQQLKAAFAALPDGAAKEALARAAVRAGVDAYDCSRYDEGDGFLAMLPEPLRLRVIEWYFWGAPEPAIEAMLATDSPDAA